MLKEEAKLPTKVYKGLFRKGIMNNMSTGMKAVMLPQKEPTLATKLRNGEDVAPPPITVEALEDTRIDFSEKSPLDLNPVGNGSVLDDFFAMGPPEADHQHRGDSGGSVDHTTMPEIIVETIRPQPLSQNTRRQSAPILVYKENVDASESQTVMLRNHNENFKA